MLNPITQHRKIMLFQAASEQNAVFAAKMLNLLYNFHPERATFEFYNSTAWFKYERQRSIVMIFEVEKQADGTFTKGKYQTCVFLTNTSKAMTALKDI